MRAINSISTSSYFDMNLMSERALDAIRGLDVKNNSVILKSYLKLKREPLDGSEI